MPAVSVAQAEAARIELAHRRAGGRPRRFASMDDATLSEYASTSNAGLPQRAPASKQKRRQRIAHIRSGG